MAGAGIRFDQVGLTTSGVQILNDVSFEVIPGEIHCLIGPNGGGKTSAVRCLLGQMPHSGAISIDWKDGTNIGYVPQLLDFDKTLPVTVGDFMAMVCQDRRPAFTGMGRAAREQTSAALERVGLDTSKQKTRLGSLSGGERQRVLFAQSLIPAPDLLILDEPMTSMDEVGINRFLELIRQFAADGVTVLWIAHELDLVRRYATTVTCISGTVLFSGRPDEVLTDKTAETLFRTRRASA